MPDCPNCQVPLITMRQRNGLFYQCPNCGGRAVTLPQIRRVAGDRFATNLIRQINTNRSIGERCCPFCPRPMRVFDSAQPPLELDACKSCATVWFDRQEFEAVPEKAVPSTNELRLAAAEAFGRHRIEQASTAAGSQDYPDEAWHWIPALLGFPVETEVSGLRRLPWFTWSLALLVLLVSVWAFRNLDIALARFAFVPAEALTWGGLTSLTSFFLHAGAFHLISNLYFLVIFGDNVEDEIGRWRYGLLILAATVTGDAVHWLANPASTTPCVGASGGISGVIVFYALQFPRARLGFVFRYFVYFRWLQIPAWGALVLWLLLQGYGLVAQLSGFGNVAATAHLGGAAVGFVAWFWWRWLQNRAPTGEVGKPE